MSDKIDNDFATAVIGNMPEATLKTLDDMTKEIKNLQVKLTAAEANFAKADLLNIFYLEGLDKSEIQLTDKDEQIEALAGEVILLQAQKESLKEFARTVIKEECWGITMDGLEIQDLAVNLGLLVEEVATEEDIDEDSDFEVGDKMYKFTDVLRSE